MCTNAGLGARVQEKHRAKLPRAPKLGFDKVWCCVSFVRSILLR